jgi:hypothetical protein
VLPHQSVADLFIPMVSVGPHRIPSMGREFSPLGNYRAAIVRYKAGYQKWPSLQDITFVKPLAPYGPVSLNGSNRHQRTA